MKRTLFTLAATALFSTTLFAQPYTVNQRRENQQDRIAQGVRSGQLTAGETARLEHREQHINRQIRADRSAHDGRLTGSEHRQINREQNRTSRAIYRDKHNASHQRG